VERKFQEMEIDKEEKTGKIECTVGTYDAE
jgi:hypothetical protein